MDQLARLGVVFDQEGADPLIKNLEKVAATSKTAEAATEQFADSTKKAATGVKAYSGSVSDMNAHVQAYVNHAKALKVANDNAAKSMNVARYASLNLSRNLADVGVSASMGMNPLMILIQQGPQIADAFQTAAMAGVSFKTVIKGLVADIVPLVATFAPWIAGLAAVGAGVWYLVNAQQKHDEEIKTLTKDINDFHKKLEESVPTLIQNANSSELAAEGTRNFEAWLQKTNGTLETHIKLLREAALTEYNQQALKAGDQLRKAQAELDRVNKRGPAVMAGGMGGFSAAAPQAGPNSARVQEAQKLVDLAKEDLRLATERLKIAGQAPDKAFSPDSTKAPKKVRQLTQKEKEMAAAVADGRFASANGRTIALSSVGTVGQENYTAGKLNKYSPGGDSTINGDPLVDNAEEASKKLLAIQRKQAEDRKQIESDMWSNLISLSSSGNKKLAAIGRAAAISQATIDGILSVQKALAAFPPPFNFVMAGVVGAAAALNVAKIAGVKGFASGGYTGNGGVGEPAGVVHGKEFVVNAAATRQNRAALEAMNAGRAIPTNPANSNTRGRTRVTVVKGDLFDAIIEENAARVAAPMAKRAEERGAEKGALSAADQYQRQNQKRLA